jgi:MFS family permease
MPSLQKNHLFILAVLICFASVSAVLFTPALPDLAAYFNVSEAGIQWSVSLYLIGYATGQLPYGPIANRFGRKKALFAGLSLSLLGCLLCLFAPSFWVLCIGRFIQALGAAASLKLCFTMIGDSFEGPAATSAISLIALSFSVAPGLAVAFGGILTSLWGWHGCFAFLALYTIALTAFCRSLPETSSSTDPQALSLSKIIKGLKGPLNNPSLVLLSIIYGFGTAVIYVFSGEAPYIAIQQMGLSPSKYGFWAMLPSLGLGVGLCFTNYIGKHWNFDKGMQIGLGTSLAGLLLLTGLLSFAKIPVSFFLPMILILAGIGATSTFASAKVMSLTKDKSNASAVMSFLNMGMAALWVLITTPLTPLSSIALTAIFYLLILASWICTRQVIRREKS